MKNSNLQTIARARIKTEDGVVGARERRVIEEWESS
jgi:hypothetical protein